MLHAITKFQPVLSHLESEMEAVYLRSHRKTWNTRTRTCFGDIARTYHIIYRENNWKDKNKHKKKNNNLKSTLI